MVTMISGLDNTQLAIAYAVTLVLLAFVIWGWAKIFSKAGYSPLLGILMMVPLVGLITFFWFAFSKWPVYRQAGIRPQGSQAA
jgi:hypothetical protein